MATKNPIATNSAATATNNAAPATNNAPSKSPTASKTTVTNNAKPKKKIANSSLSYAKNVPLLIINGIFLFFVLYYLLKAKKSDEKILKRKIDAEIRKKLYYTDDYY